MRMLTQFPTRPRVGVSSGVGVSAVAGLMRFGGLGGFAGGLGANGGAMEIPSRARPRI